MASLSQSRLQDRYSAAWRRLKERVAAGSAAAGVNPLAEAISVAHAFEIARKRRAASEYMEVADYLLRQFAPEVAYSVAIEIDEQFEGRLGYPPIGQIVLALERLGGERAAQMIACSLMNFPQVETARLAFGVFTSDSMRSLIRAELLKEDRELADTSALACP